jgi:GTPase SAR1 family protein
MGCCSSSPVSAQVSILIAIFGLDDSGKSSVFSALLGKKFTSPQENDGYQTASMKDGDHIITLYDFGYDSSLHTSLWKREYPRLWGFLYIVDSSNSPRISDSIDLLSDIRSDPRMLGKPYAVIANKSDVERHLNAGDIKSCFPGAIGVFNGSALTPASDQSCNKGVKAAFDELMARIQQILETLAIKVSSDLEAAKEDEPESEGEGEVDEPCLEEAPADVPEE